MDCQLFERQVQLHIDGLLSAKEREDMFRHAGQCPSCAALLHDMTALEGLLSARLMAVEPPAGFADAVMAALPPLTVQPAARAKTRVPVWRRWGTVAAAAVLLLAAGLYSLWPGQPEGQQVITSPDPASIAQVDPPPDPRPQPVQPQSQQQQSVDPVDPEPDVNEDPEDPAISDNPDIVAPPPTEETPVTLPPPVKEEAPPEPYAGSVDLPMPATELPQPESMFSLTVLAAYEDCDAVLPSLNADGLVEFYTKYKGQIHLWTQSLGAEEAPVHQGQVKALPTLPEIMGSVEESAAVGFSCVTAVSTDGRFTAVNRGGEKPGIWLYESAVSAAISGTEESAQETGDESVEEHPELGTEISGLGGGKVLCWSPDSNKLLYTDETGRLFVYYLYAEQQVLPLYSGTVTCASWAGDSSTVVFAGKMEKSERSAIYAIMVP